MRRVIATILATVDGFCSGINKEYGFAAQFEGDAFRERSIEKLRNMDALLFGRATYDIGAAYWPTQVSVEKGETEALRAMMNGLPKFVFSSTLSDPTWPNTTVLRDDAVKKIAELRQEPGKDLLLIGSGSIRAQLLNAGLIDLVTVLTFPIALGEGIPMFAGVKEQMLLTCTQSTMFSGGSVLTHYRPHGS